MFEEKACADCVMEETQLIGLTGCCVRLASLILRALGKSKRVQGCLEEGRGSLSRVYAPKCPNAQMHKCMGLKGHSLSRGGLLGERAMSENERK